MLPLLTAFFTAILLSHASAASFPDVQVSQENYDAIEYMKAHAIVDGYPDGTYRPQARILRAEFTKIIMNALFDAAEIAGCPARHPGRWFSDVGGSEWFAPYVCFAKEKGIVSGLPDGSFHPGDPLVFTEANKILANSFGLTAADAPAVADGIWYKTYVDALAAKNAIPRTVKKFSDPILRGEIAEMAYRLKENITDKPSQTFAEIAERSGMAQAPALRPRQRYTEAQCRAVESKRYGVPNTSDPASVKSASMLALELEHKKFCEYPAMIDKRGDAELSAVFGNLETPCAVFRASLEKNLAQLHSEDLENGSQHSFYVQELVYRDCLTLEQADDYIVSVHPSADSGGERFRLFRSLELRLYALSEPTPSTEFQRTLEELQQWFESR